MSLGVSQNRSRATRTLHKVPLSVDVELGSGPVYPEVARAFQRISTRLNN